MNKLSDAQGYIKLSAAGEEVRQAISQPFKNRKNVGYNPDFLYDYIPNQTFYLKQDIRNHLKTIGNQNNDNLPAGTFAEKIFDRLLIDLSWNSSRLEGNTYSLLDTDRLIHEGVAAEGKNAFETR